MTPQDVEFEMKRIMPKRLSFPFAIVMSFLVHLSIVLLLLKKTDEKSFDPSLEISFIENLSPKVPSRSLKNSLARPASLKNEDLQQSRQSSHESDVEASSARKKVNIDSEVTDLSHEISDSLGLESPLQKYLRDLRRRIEIQKNYPLVSRKLKEEGLVKVVIALSQNGSVLEARLAQAAPFERLNDAALLAIKKAAPFDEFPAEVQKEKWIISVPIRFSLQK